MADRVSGAKRSAMMASVRSKNTKPELMVRRAVHAAGFRFRLHRRDLPGTPDLVLSSLCTVVFVHGCFWHGHGCRKSARPATNQAFWNAKLERNLARDQANMESLQRSGWLVSIVWECSLTSDLNELISHLINARSNLRGKMQNTAPA